MENPTEIKLLLKKLGKKKGKKEKRIIFFIGPNTWIDLKIPY